VKWCNPSDYAPGDETRPRVGGTVREPSRQASALKVIDIAPLLAREKAAAPPESSTASWLIVGIVFVAGSGVASVAQQTVLAAWLALISILALGFEWSDQRSRAQHADAVRQRSGGAMLRPVGNDPPKRTK
jgi:hypothetical protein